ncbi:MAG: hypothetical protein HBSIN02_24730 [Bacteroidia bacterium]|nr:MAG: hypothetical protein HBSIN02_24730 [Bacteroidia bacterium]
MAIMYTELTGNETSGEKALYTRLKNKLSDEYSVWHNLVLHSKSIEVDFVIFHPSHGIWCIEIKDWVISQIRQASSADCLIDKEGKLTNYPHPLIQARKSWIALKQLFESNGELLHSDGIHKGKMVFPLNYGGAFFNIYESDITSSPHASFFPTRKFITADLLKGEAISETQWERKFLLLREKDFSFELSPSQINAIKAALGTNVVIDTQTKQVAGTFDDYQEKLVKYKIEKQIVIEGPAGSGKSVVLLKRALHIKNTYPSWDVGIICFNAIMANYLKLLLTFEKPGHSIDVFDVYDWAKLYLPSVKAHWKGSDNPEQAISSALSKANQKVDRQYDALLIDEGQDTSEVLLKLYRAMLKPSSNSLTFCFDKRQSLYTTGELVDRLNEFGFSIDNEKELVKQQRSVLVLLALAFYKKSKEPANEIAKIITEVYELADRFFYGFKQTLSRLASGVGRFFGLTKSSGPPDLKKELQNAISCNQCKSTEDMIHRLCDDIVASTKTDKASFQDWLVVFPSRIFQNVNLPDAIQARFNEKQIPFVYIDATAGTSSELPTGIGDNRRSGALNSQAVKLMTIHASKGYDAQHVAILAFDSLGYLHKENPAEVGYVAMTRGKQSCSIYFVERTRPVTILEDIIAKLF